MNQEDQITIDRSLLVRCDDAVRDAHLAVTQAYRDAETDEQRDHARQWFISLMQTQGLIREALTRGDTR